MENPFNSKRQEDFLSSKEEVELDRKILLLEREESRLEIELDKVKARISFLRSKLQEAEAKNTTP